MRADETEVRVLAQQLRKNGIAKTDLDAVRMAKDMLGSNARSVGTSMTSNRTVEVPRPNPTNDAFLQRVAALEEHVKKKHEQIEALLQRMDAMEKQMSQMQKPILQEELEQEIQQIEAEPVKGEPVVPVEHIAEPNPTPEQMKEEISAIQDSFIGEDMEPTTREVKVTEQEKENRGRGLSEEEKKSVDLSSMFNFGKR